MDLQIQVFHPCFCFILADVVAPQPHTEVLGLLFFFLLHDLLVHVRLLSRRSIYFTCVSGELATLN